MGYVCSYMHTYVEAKGIAHIILLGPLTWNSWRTQDWLASEPWKLAISFSVWGLQAHTPSYWFWGSNASPHACKDLLSLSPAWLWSVSNARAKIRETTSVKTSLQGSSSSSHEDLKLSHYYLRVSIHWRWIGKGSPKELWMLRMSLLL